MAAPNYSGGQMSQNEFLGYMSTVQGWNFFVQNILPAAAAGNFTVIGGDEKTPSGVAQLLAAVSDAGNQLGGLTIPTPILEAATHPTPPAPVTPVPQTPATNGVDVLTQLLTGEGLAQSTVDLAIKLHNSGLDDNAVMAQIRQTADWQTRFSGIVARQKAGLDPGTEADQIAYEKSMDQMLKQYGITGYNRDIYDEWYGKDISTSEQSSKANIAAQWAYAEPPEARDAVQRLWGIGAGDITHWIFDPEHGVPELQKKLDAAQIAGSASRTGFGTLTAQQAMTIGNYTDPNSAASQMAKLAQQNALYTSLPGEGKSFSTDDVIRAFFGGDAATLNAIRARNQSRDFGQSGGGVAQSQKGAVGAGVAAP